jgi:hypothetical protein
LSVMNFKNFSFFSPFVQRFHIVIFYAFGLLLLQCLSTFSSANSLSNIVSCFTLFRVSCDRYNLTEELFNSLTKKCRLIEHLFLETYGYPRTLESKAGSSLVEFVTNCPNLTSLTLIRFGLTDDWARNLAESCRKLKYLNLSRSPTIKGRFLR